MVTSLDSMAEELDAFITQWRKNVLNGDEIYSLNFMRDDEAERVVIRASDLHDLLVERKRNKAIIEHLRLERPEVLDHAIQAVG